MKNERRIMWITAAILTLVSAVVLYLTHRNVPFMMDDLWYSTLLYDETPIASLGDIVKSQVWHFHHWGGRSMTHGILQFTLLAGEQAADVLNVAVTFLLAGTVCLVAGQRRLPAFLAAFGMLLGLNANWKMSMFWQAGAANYLYITTFLLFFVFCYLREIGDADPRVEGDAGGRGKFKGTEDGVARDGPALLPGITLWILSPHYPDRASFGTMALLICVILSMSGKVLRQRADLAWPLWAASVVLWLRGMYFCGEFLAMCWGWIR